MGPVAVFSSSRARAQDGAGAQGVCISLPPALALEMSI